MGLFSRRRDDASTDSDESILASDADADAFTTTLTEVLISRLRDGSS